MHNADVLIVDDSPEISELIAVLLSRLSRGAYNIFFAYDGIQGLEEVERVRPDLIILDGSMPRMNGRDFLRVLRSTGNGVPVIMVTSLPENEVEGSGYDDYIMKPFGLVELYDCVQTHLQKVSEHQCATQHSVGPKAKGFI
jgi:DNA-binding response OmpR family regulator